MLEQLTKSAKSSNFWNNVSVAVLSLSSAFAIVPEGAVSKLNEAILAKDWLAMAISFIAIVNILLHFFKSQGEEKIVVKKTGPVVLKEVSVDAEIDEELTEGVDTYGNVERIPPQVIRTQKPKK